MQIDFIGDIHGHAERLEALLKKLGYRLEQGTYRASGREVFFLGDFIDRGPDNPGVLHIVRRMVDAGQARAIMGNHEYNALAFRQENPEGGHLRKHSIAKILQHIAMLEQYKGRQAAYEEALDWFFELPLFVEEEQFRAVHACWMPEQIAKLSGYLDERNCLTKESLFASSQKDSEAYWALENSLKGRELHLPEGYYYNDKEGTKRNTLRIRWWENPEGQNYKSLSVHPGDYLPDKAVEAEDLRGDMSYYKPGEKPVFFGHYWLTGRPQLLKNNVCCLDFSIAKGGYLTAYRFEGEQELQAERFVYV